MTASPDEASNNAFLQDEVQADDIGFHDADEDLTIRPNGHVQRDQDVIPDQPSPLPTLHVSAPASPDFFSDGERRASSPQSYTHTEITAGSSDRSNRRRSIMDPRNTRFSGFINNLINRRDRDRDSQSSPISSQGRPASPTITSQNAILRNLAAAPRAVTPPPPLPPPSLQELGLSLSVLTSNLSPSHFVTPPTNGTFLSPHYLLLCHSQGLDVLPLTRPPALQPYALVRRVPFKSVVIMEERGVLVAIAGRRDGVRVYALEEVRKAVEWRMDVERGRELDRIRREDAKRGGSGSVDNIFGPVSASSDLKSKDGLPLPSSLASRKPTLPISTPGHSQSTPKTSPANRRKPPPRPPSPPPEYETPPSSNQRRGPRPSTSTISLNQSVARHASVSTIVGMGTSHRRGSVTTDSKSKRGEKSDELHDSWAGSSDDEAINIVAAGASGSAALDERTSNTASTSRLQSPAVQSPNITPTTPTVPPSVPSPPAINRSRRPSNLDLSVTPRSQISNSMPSPAPTLSTLRHTLSRSPQLSARGPIIMDVDQPSEGEADAEAEGEADLSTTPTGERISFAQALLESRLPNVPPPGTRQPQQPVFISSSHPIVTGYDDSVPQSGDEESPHLPEPSSHSSVTPKTPTRKNERSKRRRWTVLDGVFSNNTGPSPELPDAPTSDAVPDLRSQSPTPAAASRTPPPSISRARSARAATPPPLTPGGHRRVSRDDTALPIPPLGPDRSRSTPSPRASTSSNRFLPRIISNALSTRRSEEGGLAHLGRTWDLDGGAKRSVGGSLYPQTAAPKLEYVKLPGTKGAIMIKSVETAKKSFLAILCGENGEKVELFAGTYRTALGLSRTFILPDSPRNLELQLQGDDLVEVFLVFSHNVFGLEPATVRVREVRIGRAERRAARRRAREARSSGGEPDQVDGDSPALGEEDTNVAVSIGVALPSPGPGTPVPRSETPVSSRPHPTRGPGDSGEGTSSPAEPAAPTTTVTNTDDLVALAASQIGPYTTFQQLSFAPRFPLATLADDCIIPPTYPSVTGKRIETDAETYGANGETNGIELSPPPGLPLPTSLPPSKWYYRDPKGVVQGPWKASLMQSWYKDGFLPLDLPVRRDTEIVYTLLKDLRLQSVDPNHPFRPAPLPLSQSTAPTNESDPQESTTQSQPLLHPISLLAQPKHYGPPALFFSSRGGHSTAIVDARGRSVLKGRFFWSLDEEHDSRPPPSGKLGDVKRVEAFDVKDRAVIVALRQGGLEAVDVGDALLSPADESRVYLPDFQAPVSGVSRRGTCIWRIGAPLSTAPVSSSQDPNMTALSLVRKKHNAAIVGKSPGRSDISPLGFEESEGNLQDEVLFLGRNDDDVYFCERNASSFRILRLSPSF